MLPRTYPLWHGRQARAGTFDGKRCEATSYSGNRQCNNRAALYLLGKYICRKHAQSTGK